MNAQNHVSPLRAWLRKLLTTYTENGAEKNQAASAYQSATTTAGNAMHGTLPASDDFKTRLKSYRNAGLFLLLYSLQSPENIARQWK